MYEFCLACISVLQYLCLRKGGQAETRVEKQTASPESNQIDTIEMQRKKHKFINFNLRIQKRLKKGLLKILKNHKNLQEFTLKADENNLNNFRSNSKSLENFFKSFKNALKRKIKSKDFNEDFNED